MRAAVFIGFQVTREIIRTARLQIVVTYCDCHNVRWTELDHKQHKRKRFAHHRKCLETEDLTRPFSCSFSVLCITYYPVCYLHGYISP